MPSKAFRIYLKDGFLISVTIEMAAGSVVGFVVRLIDGRAEAEHDLARYDTAHGRPHLDLLTPSGKLKSKLWLESLSFDEALNLAIEDFKKNYEKYLDQDR